MASDVGNGTDAVHTSDAPIGKPAPVACESTLSADSLHVEMLAPPAQPASLDAAESDEPSPAESLQQLLTDQPETAPPTPVLGGGSRAAFGSIHEAVGSLNASDAEDGARGRKALGAPAELLAAGTDRTLAPGTPSDSASPRSPTSPASQASGRPPRGVARALPWQPAVSRAGSEASASAEASAAVSAAVSEADVDAYLQRLRSSSRRMGTLIAELHRGADSREPSPRPTPDRTPSRMLGDLASQLERQDSLAAARPAITPRGAGRGPSADASWTRPLDYVPPLLGPVLAAPRSHALERVDSIAGDTVEAPTTRATSAARGVADAASRGVNGRGVPPRVPATLAPGARGVPSPNSSLVLTSRALDDEPEAGSLPDSPRGAERERDRERERRARMREHMDRAGIAPASERDAKEARMALQREMVRGSGQGMASSEANGAPAMRDASVGTDAPLERVGSLHAHVVYELQGGRWGRGVPEEETSDADSDDGATSTARQSPRKAGRRGGVQDVGPPSPGTRPLASHPLLDASPSFRSMPYPRATKSRSPLDSHPAPDADADAEDEDSAWESPAAAATSVAPHDLSARVADMVASHPRRYQVPHMSVELASPRSSHSHPPLATPGSAFQSVSSSRAVESGGMGTTLWDGGSWASPNTPAIDRGLGRVGAGPFSLSPARTPRDMETPGSAASMPDEQVSPGGARRVRVSTSAGDSVVTVKWITNAGRMGKFQFSADDLVASCAGLAPRDAWPFAALPEARLRAPDTWEGVSRQTPGMLKMRIRECFRISELRDRLAEHAALPLIAAVLSRAFLAPPGADGTGGAGAAPIPALTPARASVARARGPSSPRSALDASRQGSPRRAWSPRGSGSGSQAWGGAASAGLRGRGTPWGSETGGDAGAPWRGRGVLNAPLWDKDAVCGVLGVICKMIGDHVMAREADALFEGDGARHVG